MPLSCKCWVQSFLFSTSYSPKGMNEWLRSNWFQAWLDGFAMPSTGWMLNQGMVLYPCNASQINKTVYTNSKPVAQDCFSTEFQLCLLHYNSYNSAHSENQWLIRCMAYCNLEIGWQLNITQALYMIGANCKDLITQVVMYITMDVGR